MDNFTVTLKILIDILEKKQAALENVLNITQNQETILQSPPSVERSTFFIQCNAEKQNLIDRVKEYDEMFQGFFDQAKGDLHEKAHDDDNKPLIIRLQALISQVVEQDVQIRAQERKNIGLLTPRRSPRPQTAAYRSQALGELNKHKKI
ncbi:MAG: hypothetical protein LBS19_02965 [Clostridiales bacterium]|jgi:hypothetical protein|nr:hypothetical protein [Clostridiales bacterium]